MFTFKFDCKQYGEAHPDVTQETLELTPAVLRGVTAPETYIVRIYDGDTLLYKGGSSVESLRGFVERYEFARLINDIQQHNAK